jgi:1-deoxyxylulose-5-phosphate synthase
VGTACFKTFGAGKLLADTQSYGQPMTGHGQVPSRPSLPNLEVPECVRYILTLDPHVAL